MKHYHLENPPITEAVIEISAKLPATVSSAQLRSVYTSDALQTFTKEEDLYKMEGRLRTNKSSTEFEEVSKILYGYRRWDEDNKKVLSYSLNGMTLSYLKPYSNFSMFTDEARAHWKAFSDSCAPERITKLSSRFINIIELDETVSKVKRLKDTIIPMLNVPDGLPERLKGFESRVTLIDEETGIEISFKQQMVKNQMTSQEGIIIDIDTRKVYADVISEDAVWNDLKHIRKLKNDVFFSLVTLQQLKKYGLREKAAGKET